MRGVVSIPPPKNKNWRGHELNHHSSLILRDGLDRGVACLKLTTHFVHACLRVPFSLRRTCLLHFRPLRKGQRWGGSRGGDSSCMQHFAFCKTFALLGLTRKKRKKKKSRFLSRLLLFLLGRESSALVSVHTLPSCVPPPQSFGIVLRLQRDAWSTVK